MAAQPNAHKGCQQLILAKNGAKFTALRLGVGDRYTDSAPTWLAHLISQTVLFSNFVPIFRWVTHARRGSVAPSQRLARGTVRRSPHWSLPGWCSPPTHTHVYEQLSLFSLLVTVSEVNLRRDPGAKHD